MWGTGLTLDGGTIDGWDVAVEIVTLPLGGVCCSCWRSGVTCWGVDAKACGCVVREGCDDCGAQTGVLTDVECWDVYTRFWSIGGVKVMPPKVTPWEEAAATVDSKDDIFVADIAPWKTAVKHEKNLFSLCWQKYILKDVTNHFKSLSSELYGKRAIIHFLYSMK